MEYKNEIHFEIERKFLIAMPDRGMLEACPGASRSEIVQTYLPGKEGESRRVRSRSCDGKSTYTLTAKKHISNIRRIEEEREISASEYESLLLESDPEKRSIIKTRYCLPYGGRMLEIDIYSFWDDRATLEIELESEDAPYILPSWINVIKEVTQDPRYTNSSLALLLARGGISDLT